MYLRTESQHITDNSQNTKIFSSLRWYLQLAEMEMRIFAFMYLKQIQIVLLYLSYFPK